MAIAALASPAAAEPDTSEAQGSDATAEPGTTPEAEGSDAAAKPDPLKTEGSEVPAERRARAQALFEEGNELRQQALIARALDRYREALALYDHPYIHYNMALCLRSLGQPVKAYEHLQRALGSDVLSPEERAQAETYATAMRAEIAEVEVVCEEPGAAVSLDGAPLFSGPGTATRLVMPGEHVVLAEKSTRLMASRALKLAPGEAQTVALALPTLERRWSSWVPWTVVGAGTALALAGVPLHVSARSKEEQFKDAINMECASSNMAGPCASGVPAQAQDIADSGRMRNDLAIAAFTAGGAAVLTGAVLLYLNQPHLVAPEAKAGRLSIAPVLAPGNAGLMAGVSF